MFNVQGSEMVFLVLIALLVLGPEKLPDAIRKFGRLYAEFRKVANGFQGELRSALDEPMREIQKTADMVRSAANFDQTPPKPSMSTRTTVTPASTSAVAPNAAAAPAPAAAAPTPAAEPAPARPALNFGNPAARRPATAETPADAPEAAATGSDDGPDRGAPT